MVNPNHPIKKLHRNPGRGHPALFAVTFVQG